MATMILEPQLVATSATLINTGTDLYISIPLSNIGNADAPRVFVTGIKLQGAESLSPKSFPLYVGNLAIGNVGAVNARFHATGLTAGQELLLAFAGTYQPPRLNYIYGFRINLTVVVPAVAPYPVPLLKARAQAVVQPAIWNYTIFNNEPANSTQFLSGFSLQVAAPVQVTSVPAGWGVETDSSTFVYWFAADEALPFSHHVRPGASLGGFQIQSATSRSEVTPYIISSWKQDITQAGLVAPDVVASPLRP